MDEEDYKNLSSIVEQAHEKESWYKAGVFKLVPNDTSLNFIKPDVLLDLVHNTKVAIKHQWIIPDLLVDGTYSLYTKHRSYMKAKNYFERFNKDMGNNAREVVDNLWAMIREEKMSSNYEWYYGADNDDSFQQYIDLFNLDSLTEQSLLGKFDRDTKKTKGIFSSYSYFGVTGSLSGIHIEDADLMSLNALLWGSPKHWLSVGEQYREEVVRLMAKSDTTFKAHPHHYRCKMMVVSPAALESEGIPLYETFQHRNEIIVTMCGAFHQVINTGKIQNFAMIQLKNIDT